MKLNPKCIRDLLEVFETTVQDANTTYYFESMEDLRENDSLSEYTPEEQAYHCQQLYLSGFFYHGGIDDILYYGYYVAARIVSVVL